jgi:RimJ/RimL family protein N-acetyltransferase
LVSRDFLTEISMNDWLVYTPTLETPRLILRPAKMDDAPIVQRKFAKWEIVNLLARVPWPYPADGAETHLRKLVPQVEARALCAWSIYLRDGDGELIGAIILKPFDGANRSMRGFWLDTPHWGKGYMTEAANAVTDFAFRQLHWPFIWISNPAANTRSSAVKERQEAVLIETTEADSVSGEGPRQIWRIDANDWLARS